MWEMIILLISCVITATVNCTIDVSLPELEYLANHLEPEECWKLAIMLHSSNFGAPNERGQNQLPAMAEVNCLEQLLHWNSGANEGLDQTQAVLAHRLRQIGRNDLSDWLTKTVYEELGEELNKTLLSDPFKELAELTSPKEYLDFIGNNSDQIVTVHNTWKPYDTILTLVIIVLFITLVWLVIQIYSVVKSKNIKPIPRNQVSYPFISRNK